MAAPAAPQFKPFDTKSLLPAEKPSAEVQVIVAALPVVSFEELMHRGEPSDHKPASDSHEGCLLSVSEHPDEWQQIARTLKGDDYVIQLPGGPLRLVDMHKIRPKTRTALRKLGIALGLVQKTKGYKISWWDDEAEDTYFYTTCEKSEADAEAGEEGRTVTSQMVYLTTPKLATYWGLRHGVTAISSHDTLCALISYLAEWSGSHHGLWWQDTYDPASLSCPRGGLFQSVLSGIEITPAS